jgi:hypothetical protein
MIIYPLKQERSAKPLPIARYKKSPKRASSEGQDAPFVRQTYILLIPLTEFSFIRNGCTAIRGFL